jgi:hypothetical protein
MWKAWGDLPDSDQFYTPVCRGRLSAFESVCVLYDAWRGVRTVALGENEQVVLAVFDTHPDRGIRLVHYVLYGNVHEF